ncbi:hypothetical protein [Nannocystis radixulma]|uniref:Transposase n=1 Tax=Nannocystis radixulma TaxID=2995305 RepID=A0ABT5BEU1_9BACT|nr:hypothetical protein [Nannocystis radixulma]MDC0672662.1 hypothetical protein [Nannocystis radixulma]
MIEIKEVLRLRSLGAAKKRIAAQLRLDPKTVRRYLEVGEAHGIVSGGGPEQLTDARLDAVIAELKKPVPHEHGEAWRACERERTFIEGHLQHDVRLTKIRKLLQRQGVVVPYATLHRFATQQLGFGKKAATVPLADGKPGERGREHDRRRLAPEERVLLNLSSAPRPQLSDTCSFEPVRTPPAGPSW